MKFPWYFFLPCLTLRLVAHGAVFAGASPGSDPGGPATPEDTARGLPSVRLAPLDGIADEAAQIQLAAARAKDFAAQAEQNDESFAQAGRFLDAANVSLALELEPFCTRRILGLESPPGVGDAAARETLDRAKAWVTRAEAQVRAARDPEGELPATWTELSRRTSILRAFAAAQDVYLFPPDAAEAVRERRQAASFLSPALEDDDPRVAAAANLWLTCVRGEEGKAGPALSTMELPLAEPAKGSMPYAFFSRLNKCRLLAVQGHPATAVSLLMQLEDRSLDWFTTDVDRSNGERAAALVRWSVLESWRDRLFPDTYDEERRWCDEGRNRIRRQLFERGEPTILRLYPSVPLLSREADMVAPGSGQQP